MALASLRVVLALQLLWKKKKMSLLLLLMMLMTVLRGPRQPGDDNDNDADTKTAENGDSNMTMPTTAMMAVIMWDGGF